MKIKFLWDWQGHWVVARNGNTTVLHFASICRATSPDGIVLYKLTLGPLCVVAGRKNQQSKPINAS